MKHLLISIIISVIICTTASCEDRKSIRVSSEVLNAIILDDRIRQLLAIYNPGPNETITYDGIILNVFDRHPGPGTYPAPINISWDEAQKLFANKPGFVISVIVDGAKNSIQFPGCIVYVAVAPDEIAIDKLISSSPNNWIIKRKGEVGK